MGSDLDMRSLSIRLLQRTDNSTLEELCIYKVSQWLTAEIVLLIMQDKLKVEIDQLLLFLIEIPSTQALLLISLLEMKPFFF